MTHPPDKEAFSIFGQMIAKDGTDKGKGLAFTYLGEALRPCDGELYLALGRLHTARSKAYGEKRKKLTAQIQAVNERIR